MSLFTLQALGKIAIDASNATVCCRVLQTDFPAQGKLSLQLGFQQEDSLAKRVRGLPLRSIQCEYC